MGDKVDRIFIALIFGLVMGMLAMAGLALTMGWWAIETKQDRALVKDLKGDFISIDYWGGQGVVVKAGDGVYAEVEALDAAFTEGAGRAAETGDVLVAWDDEIELYRLYLRSPDGHQWIGFYPDLMISGSSQ